MQVRILGCGPSGGVPLVGGSWGNCDPANPKNHRRRTSALIHYNDFNILIDTSPDLRLQLLDADIKNIDAILYTHDHADHTHGIDELRPFFMKKDRPPTPIPVYSDQSTIEKLENRFAYIFDRLPFEPQDKDSIAAVYPQLFAPHIIDTIPFDVFGLKVRAFVQDHGFSTTLGYRFPTFAYSTDVVALDETAFQVLEGVDTWFVDCLNVAPRPTHAHVDLTLSWIERIRPRRAILIHMDQSLDYEALKKRLPPVVEPAYDGMIVEV